GTGGARRARGKNRHWANLARRSRRGARPRRPRPSRRAERLRPGAEASLTAAPADRTQRGRLAWSASTEATLAVTRTPVGTCRYPFGPCALLSGPRTPVR